MAKRFTETLKWDDPWFLELTCEQKMLWIYLLDKCDISGVIDFSPRHADFFINGESHSSSNIKFLSDRITLLDNGKYFINGFIEYQYGTLKQSCKPHLAVIRLLEKHGISIDDIKQSDKKGKTHSISSKTRTFVIGRDGKKCTYCDKEVNNFDITLDHVVPRSKGGGDQSDNLVVACSKCNSSKGDQSLIEFIEKNNLPNSISERVSERVSNTLQDKDKDKNKEKKKDKFVLPDWISQDSWDGFVEMRKKIKKPLTDRACTGIINKLDKLGKQNADAILDQSTENCWQTVYELKEQQQQTGGYQSSQLL